MLDESWINSFDPQQEWWTAERRALKSRRKKTAQCCQGAWKSCTSGSQLKWSCAWPSHAKWYDGQWPILLHTVGGYFEALHHKLPELLELGIILLQDNATPLHHCDVQNFMQCWGWDVLAHPPFSPDLAPCDYWLLTHVKEYLWGKWFKLEDDANIAVTATLHHLSKDVYKAALYLPHRWEKCAYSAGDYNE
jgi:hypothetical protein